MSDEKHTGKCRYAINKANHVTAAFMKGSALASKSSLYELVIKLHVVIDHL